MDSQLERDKSLSSESALPAEAIANFSHLKQEEVVKDEVETLLSDLSSPQEYPSPLLEAKSPTGLDHLYRKYLPRHRFKDTKRGGWEAESMFKIRAEALLNLKPSLYTFGLFTSTYFSEMTSYQQEMDVPINTSLLIGAATADSIDEYRAVIRSINPSVRALVVDLESGRKQDDDDFLLADGTNIPLKEDSVDIATTNCLLSNLFDVKELRSPLDRLFDEIFRVLRPGGLLSMVEGNLFFVFNTLNQEKIIEKLKIEIKKAGFVDIKVADALGFQDRLAEIQLLSSGKYQSRGEEKVPYNKVLNITARKPS